MTDGVTTDPSPGAPAEIVRRTARQIMDAATPLLLEVLRAWHATLPSDAASSWRRGAVYIRESTLYSGVGDAPEMQLRNTLVHLAMKHVYVPVGGVYFEVASGASLVGRHEFQRLFEETLAGGFKVIGVFAPDRLFRNQSDAIRIRREFREHGIELEYLGKFEGDPKDAAAYQLNAIVDLQSDVQARMASQYVGRHFEALSRQGRPVSKSPEVYQPCRWAPSFLGRPGSVIGWQMTEPLASIIKEGCQRFLGGATLTEVAAWSATTMLGGTTPKKRPMDATWWRQTLTNPKFAGYHHPTVWAGFGPTKSEKARAREESRSQLVPSVLPSLWDLETYERVLATLRERWRGPKHRAAYQSYLLSGIAFDEDCGRRLFVTRTRNEDGRYWMGCLERSANGPQGRNLRADVAEQELNDVIRAIQFDDTELIEQIEVELQKRIETSAAAVETFRPNPEIAALRTAVAALERVASDVSEARDQLLERIDQLDALDETHRQALDSSVVEFREAMSHLANWAATWREADDATKNKLLRAAEVRVHIDRLPGERQKPAHLRRITSDNPVFNLALAAGLQRLSRYETERPRWPAYLEIDVALGENQPVPAVHLGLPAGASTMRIAILSQPGGIRARVPVEGGPWWTTGQVASALDRNIRDVQYLIRSGLIVATIVVRGQRRDRLIHDDEFRRVLADPPMFAPRRTGRSTNASDTNRGRPKLRAA
jgi:hypothetical protein